MYVLDAATHIAGMANCLVRLGIGFLLLGRKRDEHRVRAEAKGNERRVRKFLNQAPGPV